MNSQKFFLGGIVGGIVYLLLGWLIYGMLLRDFMSNNMSSPGIMKADADMIWWALIAGNISMGFLLTYVLGKAKVGSAGAGASVGFMLGLLMSLSFDLIMFATSNVMSSLKGLAVDVAVSAVMSAIAGAVVGAILGGKKSMTTA
jgi:hypothetical protein